MLKQKSLGLHENVEVEKQRRTSTFHFNSVKYYSNRWQHMALKKKKTVLEDLCLFLQFLPTVENVSELKLRDCYISLQTIF